MICFYWWYLCPSGLCFCCS